MKKLYPKLFLGFFFLAASLMSFAQISVTATAGTAGPTAYTSLNAAFSAVNAGTHQGAVTISVTGNTTETVQPYIVRSGKGAALYTSVTVKPAAGTNPVITGKFNSFLVILDSTTNVTFDGSNTAGGTTKNLTIQITDSTGVVMLLSNSASNNVVKNCILKGATTSLAILTIGTAGATATAGNNNNLIENNDITKSNADYRWGIYNFGTSGKPNTGNIFRNNRIIDFSLLGYIDGNGSTTGFSNNTLIEGNEFFFTTPSANPVTAILLNNASGVVNTTITKNNIHDLTSTSTSTAQGNNIVGIDLYDAASATVTNNFISLNNTTLNIRGIAQETGAGSIIKVYHNTVVVSGTTAAYGSFAFLKNYQSTGDDIKNNIFVNTRVSSGTSKQYAILKTDVGTYTSNYNDLVSTGNALNFVGGNSVSGVTTDYTTLANWQAGVSQDANSVSIAPVFVSATDLHLTAANSTLDNKGTPIASVTVDIDGQARSATTPDMGADEFTATATCTAPTITTQPAAVSTCVNTNATFTVVGAGTTPGYQWQVSIDNGATFTNIAGATAATLTLNNVALSLNNYRYRVVITNGCGTITSNAATLTVNACTSVPRVDETINSVVLMPNVVNSVTTLRVMASRSSTVNWNIVDAQGRVVMSFTKMVAAGQNDFELRLSHLPAGSYHVAGETSKGTTATVRLIKL